MRSDEFGQQIYSERDLCDLFMQDPTRKMVDVLVDEKFKFDQLDLKNIPQVNQYIKPTCSPEEFDQVNQKVWWMPPEYAEMDIVIWVLSQCKTKTEQERVTEELIKFADRDMIPLLRYIKYLVDTMRKHQVLWGVGRGSSTSSYVLYLIGIHRIDSILYGLSVDEFLK